MNGNEIHSVSFFGIKKLGPVKQFLIAAIPTLILVLTVGNSTGEGDQSWLMGAGGLALFAWLSPIINSFQDNPLKQIGKSVLLFIIFFAAVYYGAEAVSEKKFQDINHIKNLYAVVVMFFFFSIMACTLIRVVYQFATKENEEF